MIVFKCNSLVVGNQIWQNSEEKKLNSMYYTKIRTNSQNWFYLASTSKSRTTCLLIYKLPYTVRIKDDHFLEPAMKTVVFTLQVCAVSQ